VYRIPHRHLLRSLDTHREQTRRPVSGDPHRPVRRMSAESNSTEGAK
jgi:hypothetical protein